jgi:hypothetical protein
MKISKKIYSSIWNSDLNVFSSIIKKIASITIAIGLSSIILSVFILRWFSFTSCGDPQPDFVYGVTNTRSIASFSVKPTEATSVEKNHLMIGKNLKSILSASA